MCFWRKVPRFAILADFEIQKRMLIGAKRLERLELEFKWRRTCSACWIVSRLFRNNNLASTHAPVDAGWGLGSQIRKYSVSLSSIRLRRWQSGELLGVSPINQQFGDQYVIHRSELHRIICTAALDLPNVTLIKSSHVLRVDFFAPSVFLSSGQTIEGDVVLGADGIRSCLRKQLLLCDGVIDRARPTGDAAFRIMIPCSQMRGDPDLEALISEPAGTRWMGPERHVMGYPIGGHKYFNLVLIHPDGIDTEESWSAEGSKEEVLLQYKGWDPVLTKLLALIPDERVKRWKLCTHDCLDTWVSGSFTLLGDACHPML